MFGAPDAEALGGSQRFVMQSSSVDKYTPLTFRTLRKHWISAIASGILLLLFFPLGLEYILPGIGAYIGVAIWLGSLYIALRQDLLPMWYSYLSIDKDGLSGKSDKESYKIYWADIMAAKLVQDKAIPPYLRIAIDKDEFYIPLRFMDVKQIWQRIQEYVAPNILGDTAYEKWIEKQEFYGDLIESSAEFIQNVKLPLRTQQKGLITVLGWFFVIAFAGIALMSILLASFHWFPVSVFTIFAIFSSSTILPDIVEMDAQKITHIIPPFGKYQIFWDEVERIEHSRGLDRLIFYGNNKRLAMMGPSLWAKPSGEVVDALLQAQVLQRKIETRVNPTPSFIVFSKNTRVK